MQRLSSALLLVIAVMSGYTAGMVVSHPVVSDVPTGRADGSATARAFYDALELALSGGSTDSLATLISPAFVDHDAETEVSLSASAFLDRVREHGQTPANARFAVDAIEVSGRSLVVQLSHEKEAPRLLAGLTIAQKPDRHVLEVLRVERGRVIERWTSGLGWLQATELGDIALPSSGQDAISTTLSRITLPPGVEHRWDASGHGFLLIESGAARVIASHAGRKGETFRLDRGAAIDLTAGDGVRLRSVDGEPVTALVFLLMRRGATEGYPTTEAQDARTTGVEQTMLWNGPAPEADGWVEHRVATVVIPAGSEIRFSGERINSLGIVVNGGVLEIAAPGTSISVLGDDLWPVEHPNLARIEASNAASVTGADAIHLRNVSEDPILVVLIPVTLAPRPDGRIS